MASYIVRMSWDHKWLNVVNFGPFDNEDTATRWAKDYYKRTGTASCFNVEKITPAEQKEDA